MQELHRLDLLAAEHLPFGEGEAPGSGLWDQGRADLAAQAAQRCQRDALELAMVQAAAASRSPLPQQPPQASSSATEAVAGARRVPNRPGCLRPGGPFRQSWRRFQKQLRPGGMRLAPYPRN